MDGYTFTTSVRVRFADTDAQGIAHNASYLVWYEVARVEYLREYAGGYQALRDHGIEARILSVAVRNFGIERAIEIAEHTAGRPHPYVVGTDSVKRYMKIAEECSKAWELRVAK